MTKDKEGFYNVIRKESAKARFRVELGLLLDADISPDPSEIDALSDDDLFELIWNDAESHGQQQMKNYVGEVLAQLNFDVKSAISSFAQKVDCKQKANKENKEQGVGS